MELQVYQSHSFKAVLEITVLQTDLSSRKKKRGREGEVRNSREEREQGRVKIRRREKRKETLKKQVAPCTF